MQANSICISYNIQNNLYVINVFKLFMRKYKFISDIGKNLFPKYNNINFT